jgi:hypothetical protein
MQKLLKIWKDRKEIIQGIYNYYLNFKKAKQIKNMSEERLKICRSNKCGYYDQSGTSEKVFINGEEACGVCGCNLKFLTSSQDSQCSLDQVNKEPLWNKQNID